MNVTVPEKSKNTLQNRKRRTLRCIADLKKMSFQTSDSPVSMNIVSIHSSLAFKLTSDYQTTKLAHYHVLDWLKRVIHKLKYSKVLDF